LCWKDSVAIPPSETYAAGKGIQPSTYCAWSKDLREAGKERLTGHTVRDATKAEVQVIERENTEKTLIHGGPLNGGRSH